MSQLEAKGCKTMPEFDVVRSHLQMAVEGEGHIFPGLEVGVERGQLTEYVDALRLPVQLFLKHFGRPVWLACILKSPGELRAKRIALGGGGSSKTSSEDLFEPPTGLFNFLRLNRNGCCLDRGL